MRPNELAHVDLVGWGTMPRHCSQSVLSEPVERYYDRAALVYVCHLGVRKL